MSGKEKTVHQRLADIMKDAKAVGKNSKNSSQGFLFRGIDDVMNHLHPIFAKHEVIILPEVLEDHTEERKTARGSNLIYRVLKIRFNFQAPDGSQTSCVMMGEGMDSGDKASNKAHAIALKYALTQMLLLPYDEVDPDGESHAPSERVRTARKPAPSKADPAKKAIEAFEGLGLEGAQNLLEDYLGKASGEWGEAELEKLRVPLRAVKGKEKSLEDFFGHLMEGGG